MKRVAGRKPPLIALASLLLAPMVAAAQPSESPAIVAVRVGIADHYRVGLWTQVEVRLRGGRQSVSGQLSLTVPDGDGVPSCVVTPPDQPCRLEPGKETTVRLLCRFGRVRSTLTAELQAGSETIARKTFETADKVDDDHYLPGMESQRLIVTVGPTPLSLEHVGKIAGLDLEHRPVAVHVGDWQRLPTHWCGYEGVDAVIITGNGGIDAKLTPNSEPVQALDQWVRMGGRLVLSMGAQAEKGLAAGSPLQSFAPGRLEKMVPLRQTGALESFCGSRSGVPQTGGPAMRVPRLADVHGMVEAHEADLPVVVRKARGFGQVIFVAVDLNQPPFDHWHDRPLLLAKLLDLPLGAGDELAEGAAMMHFGYGDLSGQLRSALDRFDDVQIAPFWLVAALIVVYLLLIGPGDYFFLRKFARRMTWTWCTFSLLVVLTCVGAYLLAFRLKGNEVRFEQADVVDVDAASGLMRGQTWTNLFSPKTETYDLRVRPHQPGGRFLGDSQSWMAWFGLPGKSLGGMNPQAGGTSLWSSPYRFSPNLDALYEAPIQVWATKSFCARWNATTKVFPEAELADESQFLVGSIVNTLDFPLEQCILAYGRSVYELGALRPGQAARLGPMSKRSELKTLLTGRKIVFTTTGDKFQQEATPYDQSSTDIPYILRMMMFFDAAGGRRYTGLWNDYQSFVDLSALLKADRAILMAQAPDEKQAGATLLRDDEPLDGSRNNHVTMYRFVFPVKK